MRLKYSQLRYLAALSTGACGMVMAICILWSFTLLPIQDVIFISLFVYFIVGGAIGLMTEPKRKPIRRPRQFCMYNIKGRHWDVR